MIYSRMYIYVYRVKGPTTGGGGSSVEGRICRGLITGGKYMWGAYNWGDVYVGCL